MTTVPDWDILTDAELASAAAAGDRRAFASIYDRYADRLHDFCVGMLRDRHAAADCVQDVFCAAASRLPQLREPDKLRPWLYAIARNEALRFIRARGRERVSDEMPETVSTEPGPNTLVGRGHLATLIADAAGGLSDRDRSVLELAYRHGLDGPELAEALGVSAANAKKMTQRLRETIERSLGALLVSRRVRSEPSACPELAEILAGWDGQFNVLMRKRIARHIESCPTCEEERRRLVSPAALLGAVPVFIRAPEWMREQTLDKVDATTASQAAITDTADSADGGEAAPEDGADAAPDDATEVLAHSEVGGPQNLLSRSLLSRRSALPVALFAAALMAAIGLTVALLYQPNARMGPADVSETAPPPSQLPRSGSPAPPAASTIAPSESPTTTIPGSTTVPTVQPPVGPSPTPSAAPTPAPQTPNPTSNRSTPSSVPPTTKPTQPSTPPPVTEEPQPSTPPTGTTPANPPKPKPPVGDPPTVVKPPESPPPTTGPPIL